MLERLKDDRNPITLQSGECGKSVTRKFGISGSGLDEDYWQPEFQNKDSKLLKRKFLKRVLKNGNQISGHRKEEVRQLFSGKQRIACLLSAITGTPKALWFNPITKRKSRKQSSTSHTTPVFKCQAVLNLVQKGRLVSAGTCLRE